MLNRQRYISSELTHFVGSKLKSDDERYELLAKILREGWITYPPHDNSTRTSRELHINYNKNISESTNEMYEPSMVCFCDIPVGDLHIHMEKYSRFGLAFDKQFIASRGGGPMYYVPKNAAPVWPDREGAEVIRGQVFDRSVKECYHLLDDLIRADKEWSERAKNVYDFLGPNIFAFIRCFDHKLADNHRDNYYFEREWRILGSLNFRMTDVSRILLPKEYARRFRENFPTYCGELIFL
jgi:hypothetical protein